MPAAPGARNPAHGNKARGFTYLGVLFMVAFMGIGLAVTGAVWRTAALRDKEAQLLYIGGQYRQAIQRYYINGLRLYPQTMDDLLRDPRKPGMERYLRKRYFDPMTGNAEWGIVKGPDGGIMGVYSLSQDKPIKVAGFKLPDRAFEGAAHYSDWKFVYDPAAQGMPASTVAASPPTMPQATSP